MDHSASMELTEYREKVHTPLRQVWIDQDGKLISFHPIDSGQLLETSEQLFWERILYLSNTGYRIQ